MKKQKLDKEEQEILNAIESGKWVVVRPEKAELEHYAQIAKTRRKKK